MDAEEGASGREGHEGIVPFDVGPTRWKRMDTMVTGEAEEHPVLAPGVGEADHLELLAVAGMERVGDAESLLIADLPSS